MHVSRRVRRARAREYRALLREVFNGHTTAVLPHELIVRLNALLKRVLVNVDDEFSETITLSITLCVLLITGVDKRWYSGICV